jgi:hypothetical protein
MSRFCCGAMVKHLAGFIQRWMGVLQLLGHEVVWAEPKVDADGPGKVGVVN